MFLGELLFLVEGDEVGSVGVSKCEYQRFSSTTSEFGPFNNLLRVQQCVYSRPLGAPKEFLIFGGFVIAAH